ncbi:PREDICTED: probable nucleoredoxin 1 isoform X2 [Camelina sativa]|uniref:protein-disulfide reductase n=1 Tax=Camelina sativa TaxID=90675 RepID=A0ABM0WFT6_CAMSA|nr:PREDICTED: probable nucleoredoxin 1 isoform X2 [Camelina sativa]
MRDKRRFFSIRERRRIGGTTPWPKPQKKSTAEMLRIFSHFSLLRRGISLFVTTANREKDWIVFSAAWCGPCQRFTPQLVEVYNELAPKVGFEVVFVSGDEDEESFGDYFSKMPWLTVPFADSETHDRLDGLFKVTGIPNLVIVDDHGKLVNNNGFGVIRSYGAGAYPFTPEKMKEIKEKEDRARREQTLSSDTASSSGFICLS